MEGDRRYYYVASIIFSQTLCLLYDKNYKSFKILPYLQANNLSWRVIRRRHEAPESATEGFVSHSKAPSMIIDASSVPKYRRTPHISSGRLVVDCISGMAPWT